MSAPRLSAAVKREIVISYRAGVKTKDIADRFGVHESYPGVLAKRYDISRSNRGPRVLKESKSLRTELTPYLCSEVLKHFQRGVDLPDIALKLRCSLALAARGLAEAIEAERIGASR